MEEKLQKMRKLLLETKSRQRISNRKDKLLPLGLSIPFEASESQGNWSASQCSPILVAKGLKGVGKWQGVEVKREEEKQSCFIFLEVIFFNILEEAAGKCRNDWDVKEIISQKKCCARSKEPLLINIYPLANGEGQTHTGTHTFTKTTFHRKTGFIKNGSSNKY